MLYKRHKRKGLALKAPANLYVATPILQWLPSWLKALSAGSAAPCATPQINKNFLS